MATAEDKKYHIDKWAALLKAATWEEIRMIAGKDEYLNEASSELFKRLADLGVQEECEARERYYKERQYMVELRQEIAENKKTLEENKKELEESKKELTESEKKLAKKDRNIARKNKEILKKDKDIDTLSDENLRLRKLLEQNNISISF